MNHAISWNRFSTVTTHVALLLFSFPALTETTSTACDFTFQLSARAAPATLLADLAKRAGVTLHAGPQPSHVLDIDATGPVENLFEAILGHRNWIAAHETVQGCDAPRLTEIWILGPSEKEASSSIAARMTVPPATASAEPHAEPPTIDRQIDRDRDGHRPAAATETPRSRGRMSPAERIQEREQRELARRTQEKGMKK